MKVAIDDKEVSLKTNHQQITKQEKQRNEATAKKEYMHPALAVEIAAARQSNQKLKELILALMTKVEEKTSQVPEELDKAVKQAKADLASFATVLAAKQKDLTEELGRTKQQLGETEAGLTGDPRAM